MAIGLLAWAFEKAPVSDPVAVLVLLAISNFADENGKAWPSIERICRITRCSRPTVYRKTKDLAEAGLLEVEERKSGRNVYRTYRIISAEERVSSTQPEAETCLTQRRVEANVSHTETPPLQSPYKEEPSFKNKPPTTNVGSDEPTNGDGVVQRIFKRHLYARIRFLTDRNGRAPKVNPDLTPEIKRAIREAMKRHGEDKTKAAGVGIFYSTFHTGKNEHERLYIDPILCWRIKGGQDNVERFADLYFNVAQREEIGDE